MEPSRVAPWRQDAILITIGDLDHALGGANDLFPLLVVTSLFLVNPFIVLNILSFEYPDRNLMQGNKHPNGEDRLCSLIFIN